MNNKKGIKLIESYLNPSELHKIKKVSIKFKEAKFSVFMRLFTNNTRSYFLKVKYHDQSERFIPLSELEKDKVKQSITAFNFNLDTYSTVK